MAVESTFLRIEASKVAELMDLVGELGLSVSEVVNHPELEDIELEGYENSAHRLQALVREIQDVSSGLRLVPVGELFKRMRRTVRDLAKQTNKKIDLKLIGEDAEIDKVVVDRLYEPLVHIMRNSADHGLETTEGRIAAGKSETGVITLSAVQMGGEIQITIADDGQGMNKEKILERAREKGLIGKDEMPEDSAIWKMVFHPGFSTAEAVSNLSGRGVGMDVLNTTIRELRGRITVDSKAGVGTEVVLGIPLSLAFLDSMVMRAGERLYAVPVESVHEIFKPGEGQISEISANGGAEMVKVRDDLVQVCRLEQFYEEATSGEPKALDEMVVIIFQTINGAVALPVDEILDQQQVTVKPMQGRLNDIRGGLGCAILNTGEIAIVLDVESLSER